jgi:hypothetical protein
MTLLCVLLFRLKITLKEPSPVSMNRMNAIYLTLSCQLPCLPLLFLLKCYSGTVRMLAPHCFEWILLHPLFSCSNTRKECLIITETLGVALCRILVSNRWQSNEVLWTIPCFGCSVKSKRVMNEDRCDNLKHLLRSYNTDVVDTFSEPIWEHSGHVRIHQCSYLSVNSTWCT